MEHKAYIAYGILVVVILAVLFLGDSNSMGNDITGYAARDGRASRGSGERSSEQKVYEDLPAKGKVSGSAYVYRYHTKNDATVSYGSDEMYLPSYNLNLYIVTNYLIKNIQILTSDLPGKTNSDYESASEDLKNCIGSTKCNYKHYLFISQKRAEQFNLKSKIGEGDNDNLGEEEGGTMSEKILDVLDEYADLCPVDDSCNSKSYVDVMITLANGEQFSAHLASYNEFYYSSTDWNLKYNSKESKAHKTLLEQSMAQESNKDLGLHIEGTDETDIGGEYVFPWPGMCKCAEPAQLKPFVGKTKEVACSDSDVSKTNYQSITSVKDYGYINPYERGTAYGKDDYGNWFKGIDKCVDGSTTKIIEYFCDFKKNVVQSSTELDCPKGYYCQEGACVPLQYTGPVITTPVISLPDASVTADGQICFPAPNDGTFTFKYDKTKGKAYLELNPNKK